jgi:hypothetical protein
MTIVSKPFISSRYRANAVRWPAAWLRTAIASAWAGVLASAIGAALARSQETPTGEAARGGSSVAAEPRYVPNEVLIELVGNPSKKTVNTLATRYRLTRLESHPIALTNSTWVRWRIAGNRSVPAVVRALEAESSVRSAQPNYLFTLQGTP